MRRAVCRLQSISPYSPSRALSSDLLTKGSGETWDDVEKRVWRDRAHVTEDGEVFIPPMAFKFALDAASKYLNEKIKGQGQKTWAKKFTQGVMCVEPVALGVKKDALEPEWINANADGVRGSSKRVMRCYPMVKKWAASLTVEILDDAIPEDVFTRTLETAGLFNGVGRFAPRVGGYLGRFKVSKVEWQ